MNPLANMVLFDYCINRQNIIRYDLIEAEVSNRELKAMKMIYISTRYLKCENKIFIEKLEN
ncbi:hypothetical protein SAMN04487772_1032 [[Clostridium] polysaccharolyticum]|uniref:Uncharacterized protein n=1 Tax=[Clostridium] polysaccharolyticum TaxID=29364 RepID=A0A1H9Z537_9FIRM|nr:hypothetical protein SAMN04487772_1032 [[Clostridium] polysaccharolyticum]